LRNFALDGQVALKLDEGLLIQREVDDLFELNFAIGKLLSRRSNGFVLRD
jgi:hypothetical protein